MKMEQKERLLPGTDGAPNGPQDLSQSPLEDCTPKSPKCHSQRVKVKSDFYFYYFTHVITFFLPTIG